MRPFAPMCSFGFIALFIAGCAPEDKAAPTEDTPGVSDVDHDWETEDVTESICGQAPLQAKLVLETNCYRCHGESGSVWGYNRESRAAGAPPRVLWRGRARRAKQR